MKKFCVKISGEKNCSYPQFRNFHLIKISIFILFFIFSGCRLFSPSGSGKIPIVKIVEPADGDTISTANVVIKVEVTSNEDISRVRFFDNNLFLGEVQTYPYEYKWETGFVSNGEHSIRAEAVDISGNTGKSPKVSVLITKEDMFDWNLYSSQTSNGLNALFAYDTVRIWACGDSGFILFFDGSVWYSFTIAINNLNDIFFVSPDKGWSVGGNTLFEYNNGNWAPFLTIINTKEDFLSIFLLSDTLGWIGDSEGKIFTFLGDTLEEYGVLEIAPISDILGFTASDVWASCGGSIYHYDGSNWLLDTTFAGEKINSLFSLNGTAIWAAGTHLFYYDGTKWEMRELPASIGSNCEIKAIYFSSSNNGVACGGDSESGFIITYNGVEWREESIQKNVQLKGICKFDNGEGWAVGDNGTILHRKAER